MRIKALAYGGVGLILIALVVWGVHTYLASVAALTAIGADPEEFINTFKYVVLGAGATTVGFALLLQFFQQ